MSVTRAATPSVPPVELVLVRHALPVRVDATEDGAPADPGLADLGHQQAARLVEALRLDQVDAVYASPAARAQQTAAPLAEALGLPLLVEPGLAEFDAHHTSYVPVEELKAAGDPRFDRLRLGHLPDIGVDSGEFARTVVEAVERLAAAHPGGRAVLVSHSGTINAYTGHVVGGQQPLWVAPAYASITRVGAARDGRRGLVSLNETGHVRDLLPLGSVTRVPAAVPSRALVVGAHPDDADYGAGGLIATWAAAGCAVTVVCVTDGGAGGFDADVPRADVPGIRREEQRAAAAALGVTDVRFLGRDDGWVQVDRPLRLELARAGPRAAAGGGGHARARPRLPLRLPVPPGPPRDRRGGARRRLPGRPQRVRLPPEELDLEPWEVPAVWLFGGPSDDTVVDVTDCFEAKVRACSAHDSQTPMLDRGVEDELREDLGRVAREHGLPEGRLAEAYQVLDTA